LDSQKATVRIRQSKSDMIKVTFPNPMSARDASARPELQLSHRLDLGYSQVKPQLPEPPLQSSPPLKPQVAWATPAGKPRLEPKSTSRS
jgi:hypothetical protein